MEELHVFSGHRGGLVGVAGLEGGGEQLGVGLADLFAQVIGGQRCGSEAGGQQGQGEQQHGEAPRVVHAGSHGVWAVAVGFR